MLLHELLADPGVAATIVEVRGDRHVDVRSIVHDSRASTAGSLFCCIPGAHADGHEYAPAAVAAGAVACLVERVLAVPATQVRVGSVREAVGPASAAFQQHPSRALRVLGVTGTNGKTTTTYLLEAIARAAGERVGVVGTTGVRVDGRTLPLTHTTPEATELQALLAKIRDDSATTVAMEVSSHALDQHRVDGTEFAAVCFTNLSHDHLDYHRTIDAYFAAKARLFTSTFARRGVVNVDDAHGRDLLALGRANGLEMTTYGVAHDADVRAAAIELGTNETTFDLLLRDAVHRVQTSLVGAFNVHNALAAAATAAVAGFADDAIIEGLRTVATVPGRMERVPNDLGIGVLVDYAHTPDALASVLGAARSIAAAGRVLVVFGCGGDRDREKRPVMGQVASRLADRAYLTSDNSRSEDPAAIADDVMRGVDPAAAPVVVELDRRCAIARALDDARRGDVVVIAGKGHETGQTAHGVTVPFDDRIVALEIIEARA